MDRTTLEELLIEGVSLAEIGRRFDRHESTVAYWVAKYELQAPGRERHSARGSLLKDDLERLVAAGASIGAIAADVDRSKATVRHWLKKYGLKTAQEAGRRRSPGSRAAWDAGMARATIECPSHGAADYVIDGRGYYRCTQCRSAAVTKRRRKIKATLVAEFGGACQVCGYSRCLAALEFHHRIPAEKLFSLSHEGVTRSLERARLEAQKCVLLCGNCHAEVEAGVRSLDLSGAPE
jgi:transposase